MDETDIAYATVLHPQEGLTTKKTKKHITKP